MTAQLTGKPVDAAALRAVDELQLRYIDALDSKDLEAWLECFAERAGYTCISAENDRRGLPIAIMLDDSRERLEDRVTIIREVWSGTFEDYAARHFVQRLTCVEVEPGVLSVRSNVYVAYTPDDGPTQALVSGVYRDEVVLMPSGAKFRSKRAVLDTTVTPRYLVYPV